MKKSYFVGADVSKEKIDFCFLTSLESSKPKFVSLPNDTATIKAYFQSFIKDDIFVVFEHTNNYHVPLQSALSDLQIKHSALNPAKISHFLKHLDIFSHSLDIRILIFLVILLIVFSEILVNSAIFTASMSDEK